jgi:hypothetical protein
MTSNGPEDIGEATARFEAALIRLEGALASSVSKVADLARKTGFEDGRNHALSEIVDKPADMSPILREELEAARARESQLQDAVNQARAALDDAMDDIRTALGPL